MRRAGFLSMFRFLVPLLLAEEYCDTPQLYGCSFASDSLGLIERIKDSVTVLHPTPLSR
jgi:hypothetical protein